YAVFSYFFFSSRRRHTRSKRDWSSDVCSSDLRFILIINYFSSILRSEDDVIRTHPLRMRERIRLLCHEITFPFFNSGLNTSIIRSEERRVGKECNSWVLM